MPDWTRFRAAVVAGTAEGELPRACDLAWSWLDLAPDEWRRRLEGHVKSEGAARWMLQALRQVLRRLSLESGIDPADSTRQTLLYEAVGTGRGTPAEIDLVRRFATGQEIYAGVIALFPAAATAEPVDPRRQMLQDGIDALEATLHAKENAVATPESLSRLREAVAAFAAIGVHLPPALATDHAWWLGLAWWTVSAAARQLGRHDDEREALARAADAYERGGDAKAAEQCRERVHELALRLAGDFDTAVKIALSELLAQPDALGRARALARLAREVGATGDRYEAGSVAEQGARALTEAGYPDPETDFDAATQQWLDTAAATRTANVLFEHLCEVAALWSAMLGVRVSARAGDPDGSTRADAALRRIPEFASALTREVARARQDAVERLAAWCTAAGMPAPAYKPEIDTGAERMQELAALDDALQRLREACNAGAQPAQVDAALRLRERALAIGSRVHVARAMIEQLYVLLALHRDEEVPDLADLAVRTLLGEHAPGLAAFATGFERELYLMAIDYKARALAGRKDDEGILALCEPVIRDIEGERARVNSPYQQSAFLATRVELYEFVAAAAYRTRRLDLLLAVTELLKSRTALRSRLAPGVDTGAGEIDAQLREVNAALPHATKDTAEALQERRRWLVSARAIARARSAGALPEISLAALKNALAPDEAAVSWFWIGSAILIVLAAARDDERTAVIRLDPAQQAQLRDYAACVGTVSGNDPDWDALVPRIEGLIASLGTVLVPAEIREFIAGKERLVLSPHRTLHLFPFHATAWDGGSFLGARFAVRYAANLGSLVVPWHGATRGPVLAVGVSTFEDRGLASLPGAEAEAAAVAAAHAGNGQALLGATREQFVALPLQEFRCIHLATHGSSVLAGDAANDPLESAIYLRDGALSGWNLMELSLRAELVVLAACNSGQRSIAGRGLDQLPGDDMFGLQAVLFEAGAGAVLGALWPVEDTVSLEMLTAFHRAYARGATPDRALQAAVREQIAKAREAFDWAPFFVSALGARGGA